MLSVSITEFSRNIRKMLELVERTGEEIILTRNRQKIARIKPECLHLTALDAMSDLYGKLADHAAEGWTDEGRLAGTLNETVDPWE